MAHTNLNRQETSPMPTTFVIFGASGDLTCRKLIPALYQLHVKDRLPPETSIVGVSRTNFSHNAWRSALAASTKTHLGDDFDAEAFEQFASNIYYCQGDVSCGEDIKRLGIFLNSELPSGRNDERIFYLATAPQLYEPAIACLGAAGLAKENKGQRRLVIEKPFGRDLASARHLNTALHQVFNESQVFRIDHYLGKETVQNLLVMRFGNSIFEPLWNRNYIDHVQITVAEEVTIGGRARYYETAGVLRDMVQNHLLQLLMITAMEAPVRFEANSIRDEKVKILRAVRPMQENEIAERTLRGQYVGYREESGVAENSQTATFAAIRLNIDNWRWQGVPFYLRSGKGMSCRTTQIVIQFRDPPHTLFADQGPPPEANRLVIQIQPAEGIQLYLQSKVPDAGMSVTTTHLDFRFDRYFTGTMPDAYQRLLLDVATGDASLFARSDEVELAWGLVDPIEKAWGSTAGPPLEPYYTGNWGPVSSLDWIREQGCQWFDVCPVLH